MDNFSGNCLIVSGLGMLRSMSSIHHQITRSLSESHLEDPHHGLTEDYNFCIWSCYLQFPPPCALRKIAFLFILHVCAVLVTTPSSEGSSQRLRPHNSRTIRERKEGNKNSERHDKMVSHC